MPAAGTARREQRLDANMVQTESAPTLEAPAVGAEAPRVATISYSEEEISRRWSALEKVSAPLADTRKRIFGALIEALRKPGVRLP